MTELEIALKAVQLYAEQHPRPSHVSKSQAAEMLGISIPTLSSIMAKNGIKLNAVGRIRTVDVDRLLNRSAA